MSGKIMNKIKYIIIILFFLCSCRPEFKYEGLQVKFFKYGVETYSYPSQGWGNTYYLHYKVLKGNKHYKKNEIIIEHYGSYCIKVWMVQKKLGKVLNIIKDGYPLSWFLYF